MRHRTTDTAKGHRNYIIIACDVLLFLAMLKWLPVEPEVARGLAVLTFIGILWLTEALHVTVTALLVPVLAMFMGILPGAKALSGFADPTISCSSAALRWPGRCTNRKLIPGWREKSSAWRAEAWGWL